MVVDGALRVAGTPALKERRVALMRGQAERLVKDQPLRALSLYVRLPGKESLDAAEAIIDTFGEAPSLWLEASDAVDAWRRHRDLDKSHKDTVALYLTRLEAAPREALGTHVYNVTSFSPTAGQLRERTRQAFPGAEVTFRPDLQRQAIVDTWPVDQDDARARRDWSWNPAYDEQRAFEEYLVPNIRARYNR